MCGIVALHAPGGSLDEGRVEPALAAIRHRGPDGNRHWLSPGGQCLLGHARLSIIDLATGQHPIASEDGRYRIIVNGEFYGYEAIRQELAGRGHPFRTQGDSEIALHLYEESGPACLERLRGEFALVIWDEREQRLFAARDRFGIKPLFYAQQDGVLYLGSEVKALQAAGLALRWDLESVHHALMLGVALPDRTLFAGVRQVPPGHWLEASGGEVRLRRYWDLDYPLVDGGAPWGPEEDAALHEELRAALEEAVRLRLRADVPVGCYLSGGIDSSTVAALAARHTSALKAFTVAFDQDGYDESALAEATAARAGAEWMPLRVSQGDLARSFEESVWHSETICRNANGVAKMLLSEHVRQAGYRVVLTGEGADEILAGYHTATPTPTGAAVAGDLAAPPAWIGAQLANGRRHAGLLRPEFSAAFAAEDGWARLLSEVDVPGQLAGRSRIDQELYLWTKTVLPNHVLTLGGDRPEMASSVEGRLPFLDHHVVAVMRPVPAAVKLRKPVKSPLREAMRPLLTEDVYRGGKNAFTAPPGTDRTEEPLFDRMREILRGPQLERSPIFDPARMAAFLDELSRMKPMLRRLADPILSVAASLCVLQERFHL